MLYSRAGDYPRGQPLLYAESFSPNTPEGACPECHGIGRIHEVTEKSMVPDDSLTIRQRAIAAWPTAWGGQNLRDILVTLGYDVDRPWRDLPKKDRDWILFTDEQPTVPVYAGYTPAESRRAVRRKEEPSYQGTFTGARKHVLHTFANTQSALMKRRVTQFMTAGICPLCRGKRLRAEALSVQFAGFDIADLSRLPLKRVEELLAPYSKELSAPKRETLHPEKAMVVRRIADDLIGRLSVLLDLGLGYLTIERSTPTLSPGELQRLRLATQVRSNLFGVVYVLDEPSAGLHPADTEALLRAFERLKASGNSLFVVEHELDVVRRADWIVDVGPGAGEQGGQILYSGPPDGLAQVEGSRTRQYLFGNAGRIEATRRHPKDWLRVRAVTRNNLSRLDVDIPLGVFSCVTGISGSGKSSLISQFLVETLTDKLGQRLSSSESTIEDFEEVVETLGGDVVDGMDHVKRLVVVDQKPIGRTPRSNLATYTGLFDHVRKLFASTKQARARRYDAGRFSFNIAKGRCATCEGEGFICVELLFLPSVYAPCPTCKGSRYNDKTLEIKIAGKSVADVLGMTVDEAFRFFAHDVGLQRSLGVIREVGLGYIKLGQSATELSGGEAQRIKLATELQRIQRGGTLYILDEPTTGLHPSDVEKLVRQLNSLVDGGSSVIVVEHDMMMVAQSDWVIDMGPGAGDEGGLVVAVGPPTAVASVKESRTARYLKRALAEKVRDTQF
jgi:Excinuclease ATPase subunit